MNTLHSSLQYDGITVLCSLFFTGEYSAWTSTRHDKCLAAPRLRKSETADSLINTTDRSSSAGP
jgi:hypothetical protein